MCSLVLLSFSFTEQYKLVGSADPVFAVAGEDVILPLEWFRLGLKNSLVHFYEDHEDRNTDQIESYRGRTKLIHQELQRGDASLKLSSVRVSDEGRYKCFIQSKAWYDDTTVNVRVEAVGGPPVITVDGFDHSGGLHLQCESEGWYPEPKLEWLDSEGVSLSSETTETHRNTDRFSVKHTITGYERDSKIHCSVKLRHHMTSVIMISVAVVLSVFAGIIIATFVNKTRGKVLVFFLFYIFYVNKNGQNFLYFFAVNVILDADTAHPYLFTSDDGKQVRNGNKKQKGMDGQKDRFDYYLGALGKDGFSSGCFYFEVQVKGQTEWYLGVTRESVSRNGWIRLSPENGYWTVTLRDGGYWARESSRVSLSLSVNPQRVGVFVDYEKGLVSFYDVESMYHIYSYTDQSFDEKLYPFVCLGEGYYSWNTNSIPLIICDDY
uniref:Butyrophilin subfamily 1 member A1-like n=1 Tax=Cyprinus carpio TaxID=7962 RepID=A0A8C1T250_CYPCA